MFGQDVVAEIRVRGIQAIVARVRSGKIWDNKVFVVPIQEAIRIRTGERGQLAI